MIAKILVTGASGFIGQHLPRQHGRMVFLGLSRSSRLTGGGIPDEVVAHLKSSEIVLHLAGLAHGSYSPEELEAVNYRATVQLAKLAANSGVKRFVYVSSVNVLGNVTCGRPFSDFSNIAFTANPEKAKAEIDLKEIALNSNMEVVIIRPPMVYGAGVKANFLTLLKISSTGLPLPFGAVNNKRSMVYVGNLVDFIVRCAEHPAAANQTFLISDGEDVSLRQLITGIRSAMGCSPRLVSVPVWLFKLAGLLTGKRVVIDRLVGDLQVDSSKARTLLDWAPPYTVEQGIAATVADFITKDK